MWPKNEETGKRTSVFDGPIRMEQGFWDWLFDKPRTRSAPALEKSNKRTMKGNITVWINSNGGGEVFAASVIYTALKAHKGKVTVKVDGTAISAASVIAMAGDKILMSPTSVMMIHNPLTYAEGEVKDMQKAIDILTEVKESILNAYTKKTGLSKEVISAYMDEEKWMSADTAIELGLPMANSTQDDGVMNGIIQGARLVYNSIDKEELAVKLKQFLENEKTNKEAEDQPSKEADFLILN